MSAPDPMRGITRHAVRRVLLTVCVLCLPLSAAVGVHAAPTPEYLIKAAYLYNFALFVGWPADAFCHARCSARDRHRRIGSVRSGARSNRSKQADQQTADCREASPMGQRSASMPHALHQRVRSCQSRRYASASRVCRFSSWASRPTSRGAAAPSTSPWTTTGSGSRSTWRRRRSRAWTSAQSCSMSRQGSSAGTLSTRTHTTGHHGYEYSQPVHQAKADADHDADQRARAAVGISGFRRVRPSGISPPDERRPHDPGRGDRVEQHGRARLSGREYRPGNSGGAQSERRDCRGGSLYPGRPAVYPLSPGRPDVQCACLPNPSTRVIDSIATT